MPEKGSAEFHSDISQDYDQLYTNAYWNICGEVEKSIFNQFLPKTKGVILDAGGGTGEFSIQYAQLGHDVVLTDISSGMLKQAEKKIEKLNLKKKIQVMHQDITSMKDLKSNSFDFVISLGDPVSFCGDEKKAIYELARVAKPEAYICITIDSYFHTMLELLKEKKFEELDQLQKTKKTKFPFEFFQHNFQVQELKELFKEANLKVIKIFGIGNLINKLENKDFEALVKSEEGYKKLLHLELQYCEERSIIGFAHHLGFVGKKR